MSAARPKYDMDALYALGRRLRKARLTAQVVQGDAGRMETNETSTPPCGNLPSLSLKVESLLPEGRYNCPRGPVYVMGVWLPLVAVNGNPRGMTLFYGGKKPMTTVNGEGMAYLGFMGPKKPALEGVPSDVVRDLGERVYGYRAMKAAPDVSTIATFRAIAADAGNCPACAVDTTDELYDQMRVAGPLDNIEIPPEQQCDRCGGSGLMDGRSVEAVAPLYAHLNEILESFSDSLLDWIDKQGNLPTRMLNVETAIGVLSIDLTGLVIPPNA